MADIHIADFHRDSAAILTALYRSFPRKVQLFVDDFAGPSAPDEFGLPSARHQACFATMLWLAEAGYLNYHDTIRQEALDQVSLSHLGFTLLASLVQLPQESEPGLSHVEQLRQALKSGSSSSLQAAVLSLFEHSIRYRN